MTDFLASLTDSFGPTLLLAALAFAFAESAFGVGSLVPGETVILALSAAVTSTPELLVLAAAVATGAACGDHAGYAMGRSRSATMRSSRPVARVGVQHWDRAAALVRRHGAPAIIVSRLIPVVRTLTPAVAGASGVQYCRFALASLMGSLLWAGMWVGAGTAGSAVIAHGLRRVGLFGVLALVVGAVVLAAVVSAFRRARRGRPTRSHPRRPSRRSA